MGDDGAAVSKREKDEEIRWRDVVRRKMR